MKLNSKRIKIISTGEYKYLFTRPDFDDNERQHYFSLNESEIKQTNGYSLSSAVYFVLQLGYFKAKSQFFSVKIKQVREDVKFIQSCLQKELRIIKSFPSDTMQRNIQQHILAFVKYFGDMDDIKQDLQPKAKQQARISHKPEEMFRELIRFVEHKRFVRPGYTVFQDTISNAISNENNRLYKIIDTRLPKYIRNDLNDILSVDEDFYRLTEIKRDLKNFNYQQVQTEINKHSEMVRLYQYSVKLLPKLKISRGNIKQYASLVNYYSLYKLRRMPKNKAYLYLMCYVNYRHEVITDNLIQAFMYKVDQFLKDAKEFSNEQIIQERKSLDLDNTKMGTLIGYYIDESLFDSKFKEVAEEAYKVMSKEMINKVKHHLVDKDSYFESLMWGYFEKNHRAIAMNIRPLIKVLQFECDQKGNSVLSAAEFIQSEFLKNNRLKDCDTDKLPKRVVNDKVKPFIYQDGKLALDRYEFLVYQKLRKQIDSNKIYMNDSVNYKSFKEDVKTVTNWDKDQKKIVRKLDNSKLHDDVALRLNDLEDELEQLYTDVNKRIETGENEFVSISEENGKKSWTLSYPKTNDEFDPQFYKQLKSFDISEVFDFVNSKVGFMQELKHIKPHEAKGSNDYQCTKATIIANATRQGIYTKWLHVQTLIFSHSKQMRKTIFA